MKLSKKAKKEIREWIITIIGLPVLFVLIYKTELGTWLRMGMLETRLFSADILDTEEQEIISYDFQLRDVNGKTINFSSFKNKTVLFNVWATWCGPCKAEMPDLNELYSQVSSEVTFVMISRDEDFEDAKNYVKEKNFKFPIYQYQSSPPSMLSTSSLPTTFVISSKGKIVSKTAGMAKYNTKDFTEFILSL